MKFAAPVKTLATLAGRLASSISFSAVDTETDVNDVTLVGHDAVAYFTENAAGKLLSCRTQLLLNH